MSLSLTARAQSITASVNWLPEPKLSFKNVNLEISGPQFDNLIAPQEGATGQIEIICSPALQIEFQTTLGEKYAILASDDFVTWNTFKFRVIGNGNKFVFLDSLEKAYLFYKVNITE
jgi:hypothetical protein